MLARGLRIHDYEVWGQLGEGGMSEVWLAKHVVLSLPVIIKTLKKSVAEAAGEGGALRMFNEARLMARVTNARVVRAIDAGMLGETPYLVQEYVDGIDLAELDHSRRDALGVGLPLWFVCHVMEESCHALHAAHQAGVIHRDVKPSNLFCAPETGIRLGDFGIAVARAESATPENSGTMKFMAPEQILGTGADRTTDVYGAGATAFDLRYGRGPYANVAQAIDGTSTPRFPAPANPAEAYFQHLLGSMLAKDRGARTPDLSKPAQHFRTLSRALRPGTLNDTLVCHGKHRFRIGDCEIIFRAGDLADEHADGIVCSAKYDLRMRGGVGERLRAKGGDEIEAEATASGDHALGSCVVTTAGRLHAKKVLHAVSAWNEASCVGRAMLRSLLIADQLGLCSLALPALGTGSARVSFETSANAMMTALRWHLALGGTRLQKVTVVLRDEARLQAYRDVAEEALRGREEVIHVVDLGLPIEGGAVREDGATQLDASQSNK